MSFDSFETSIEGGTPAEVYQIDAGGTSYYYTSEEQDVTLGIQTYTAVAGLQREELTAGRTKREADFKFKLPTSDAVGQLFTGQLPGFRVRVRVSRFHRDDLPTPEVVRIFDGYVQSAAFTGNGKECTLVSRPTLGSIGNTLPRRTYQSLCNHVLYDPLTCKVDDTDPSYKASGLDVASQSANILTVSGGISGTYVDGWMDGGFVEVPASNDFRLILSQTGNALTLLTPFASTPAQVDVFAGCAHTISICSTKFDNVINYGGFAFVPTRNIFQTGLK